MSHDIESAKDISKWVGGFFFWVIRGFKGKLSESYKPQNQKRNILTGYIIQIITLFIFVWYFFRKE